MTTAKIEILQRKVTRVLGRRKEIKFKIFIKLNNLIIHEFDQGDYEINQNFFTRVDMWTKRFIKALSESEGIFVDCITTHE